MYEGAGYLYLRKFFSKFSDVIVKILPSKKIILLEYFLVVTEVYIPYGVLVAIKDYWSSCVLIFAMDYTSNTVPVLAENLLQDGVL